MTASLLAGTTADTGKQVQPSCEALDAFARAMRPISNPTLFDLAIPRSNAHAIFLHQQLPSRAAIVGGGSVPLDGDFQLYALQLEFAVNERFSIVATKDGYVDFNPDQTLSPENGFANLAAGVKYAFILQPENGFAMSGTATFEIPTGSSGVTQGEGDGAVNLILNALKLTDSWQFAGSMGLQVPFDGNAQSLTSFVSTHVSYEVSPYFIPLIELNWYHVINEGDGGNRFPEQLVGGLPGAIAFEGGDLLNWGAANARDNADIVTVAAGFRSRLKDDLHLGVAYEIPLTEKQENLMESRFTIDLIWNF